MSRYRLSLDIGTNSIGWCALALEAHAKQVTPVGILDMGARIFPDGRNPKDGSSNAVKRREARAMRRTELAQPHRGVLDNRAFPPQNSGRGKGLAMLPRRSCEGTDNV